MKRIAVVIMIFSSFENPVNCNFVICEFILYLLHFLQIVYGVGGESASADRDVQVFCQNPLLLLDSVKRLSGLKPSSANDRGCHKAEMSPAFEFSIIRKLRH